MIFSKKQKTKNKIKRKTGKGVASLKGYEFSPSFIKTGSYYATIVKVVNRYGTNRNHTYGWLTNVLPEITVPGVKAWVIEADKPVSADRQEEIMTLVAENLDTQDNGGAKEKEDSHDLTVKECYIRDLERTQILHGKGEPVIEFKIHIILVSKKTTAISEQLDRLQVLLNDNLKGMSLTSIGGEQEELLKNLLKAPTDSKNEFTTMGSYFAGNDHIVRKGVEDTEGIPIGELETSYSRGVAFMDLDTSYNPLEKDFRKNNIKGERGCIFVAAPATARIKNYSGKLSASSLWGQLVANQAIVAGHKVYHVVLNGFKYFGSLKENKDFFAVPSINEVINYIDLSEGGINPMEMFGKPGEETKVFNNGKDRLAYMFYLLSGRDLSKAEQNNLKEALDRFYVSKQLWVNDGHRYPGMLKLLEVDDPRRIPTCADFTNVLSTMMLETVNLEKFTDENKVRINDLESSLKTVLTGHAELFNSYSTVPKKMDDKYLHHYFDLSNLVSEQDIMEIVFVNAFNYISSLAVEGDVIMFHGLNKVSKETLNFISKNIDMLKKKDIRFAYLFDTIGSSKIKARENKSYLELSDIFNTKGILYNDISNDFDFNILGTMTSDEVDLYEQTLNGKEIPPHLKELLMTGSQSTQYQIRRRKDWASFLVRAEFYV